jgi:hypothetical protein
VETWKCGKVLFETSMLFHLFTLSLFHFAALFYECEAQDLQTLQTPVHGKQGILPELPRALHMESGILDKPRLPAGDDPADLRRHFSMDFLLFRDCFQINQLRTNTNEHKKQFKYIS